jgi:hypothetical protein
MGQSNALSRDNVGNIVKNGMAPPLKQMEQNGSMTDKMKKNGRKISAGGPTKIMVGRSGQNVVHTNHYANNSEVLQDQNRRTMMN